MIPKDEILHGVLNSMVVVSLLVPLSGCIDISSEPPACERIALGIEKDGQVLRNPDSFPGNDVVVRTGDRLSLQAHPILCPGASGYRWIVADTYAHQQWMVERDPSAYRNASDAPGGFGLVSKDGQAKAEFTFPDVGEYVVKVLPLDSRGETIEPEYGHVGVRVFAYFVATEVISNDGTADITRFSAFCCPGATDFWVESEGEVISNGWTATFFVDRTDQIIWQGRPQRWGGNEYQEILGHQWMETIRVEVEPQRPSVHTASHTLELRTGPVANHLDEL